MGVYLMGMVPHGRVPRRQARALVGRLVGS